MNMAHVLRRVMPLALMKATDRIQTGQPFSGTHCAGFVRSRFVRHIRCHTISTSPISASSATASFGGGSHKARDRDLLLPVNHHHR
jgi:hypothetical protein